MNINWKKAVGFGALVWAVMFVVISILVGYGVTTSGGPMPLTLSITLTVLSLILVYFAARYIAPANSKIAMQYGLVFAVVGIILDLIISRMFVPDIFSSVIYWIGYVLIVFTPMLVVKKHSV